MGLLIIFFPLKNCSHFLISFTVKLHSLRVSAKRRQILPQWQLGSRLSSNWSHCLKFFTAKGTDRVSQRASTPAARGLSGSSRGHELPAHLCRLLRYLTGSPQLQLSLPPLPLLGSEMKRNAKCKILPATYFQITSLTGRLWTPTQLVRDHPQSSFACIRCLLRVPPEKAPFPPPALNASVVWSWPHLPSFLCWNCPHARAIH